MKTNRSTRLVPPSPSRRVPATTPSRRSVRATAVRAHLFEVNIDRQKSIDRYIDYFGSAVAAASPGDGSVPGSGCAP